MFILNNDLDKIQIYTNLKDNFKLYKGNNIILTYKPGKHGYYLVSATLRIGHEVDRLILNGYISVVNTAEIYAESYYSSNGTGCLSKTQHLQVIGILEVSALQFISFSAYLSEADYLNNVFTRLTVIPLKIIK